MPFTLIPPRKPTSRPLMCDLPHHLASFWPLSPLPLSERETNPKEILTTLASYYSLHLPIFRKVWVLGSSVQYFNSKTYLLGFLFLFLLLSTLKVFGGGKNTWWVFLYRSTHLPFPEMPFTSLLLNLLHENVFEVHASITPTIFPQTRILLLVSDRKKLLHTLPNIVR